MQISCTVPFVVFARVRGLARPTLRGPCSSVPILHRELGDRLGPAARAADTRREFRLWYLATVHVLADRRLDGHVLDLGGTPCELSPRELPSCAAPMTIGATDITFLDLSKDLGPRLRVRESPDLAALRRRIAVVEVEEHGVAFATVDAGMIQEVGEKQGAVGVEVARHPRDFEADVGVAICQVVRTSIRRLAFPAVPLSPPPGDIVEGELRFGLGLAAHVAGEHGRLRGTVANTSGQPLEHLF